MKNKIDWEEFSPNYWRPDKDVQYKVVLSNWRREYSDFGGKETNPKPVLVFDILKINNTEYVAPKNKMTFSTASYSFVKQVRPIIEEAEANKVEAISLLLRRNNDGSYSVFDGGALKITEVKL